MPSVGHSAVEPASSATLAIDVRFGQGVDPAGGQQHSDRQTALARKGGWLSTCETVVIETEAELKTARAAILRWLNLLGDGGLLSPNDRNRWRRRDEHTDRERWLATLLSKVDPERATAGAMP